MTNYIIFDEIEERRKLYNRIIMDFLYPSKEYYRTQMLDTKCFNLESLVSNIGGMKIFILNIDVQNGIGFKLAKLIRKHGDFISPIILVTAKRTKEQFDLLNNILYLDLLEMNENFADNLTESIKDAHRIITRQAAYSFSSFDEIYRIPYDNIYYIEKNLNDDSITIYTDEDSYVNYATIKGVEKLLGSDPRFMKVHRSCIINIYNVSSYDCKNNVLIFKNGMKIDLISRQGKSELTKKLKDSIDV